jgi:hypothetical protein
MGDVPIVRKAYDFTSRATVMTSAMAKKGQGRLLTLELWLLSRWRTQAVPGVTYLMVVNFGQIVGRIQPESLHVQPADCAKQRIGCDDPISLRADQARFCLYEILLRVQDVDGGALTALGLALDALQGHTCGADFGLGRAYSGLGAFV